MMVRRFLTITVMIGVLLALSVGAFACGDDGEGDGATSDGAEESSELDAARGFMEEMTIAAEAGDLEGAVTAFENAHDPLHEVIEALEASDGDLAAKLDEAVDHAEEALEEGEEAEHVVEEAEEITELLEQATAASGS